MTYVRMIEDSQGDLVEIEHYCSSTCWRDAGLGDPHGNRWPCPEQADYNQHCPSCGDVSVEALDTPERTWLEAPVGVAEALNRYNRETVRWLVRGYRPFEKRCG